MKKFFTLLSLLACLDSFSGPTGAPLIRSNLYITAADGTATLVDGDLTQYDPSFSNNVDGMDARKMSNFSENIGMIRGTTTLVIERRKTIQNTDTIFYKIWNLSQSRNYQLEFVASALEQPGLSAYVEDQYLHTTSPVSLNSSSYLNFTINNDAASRDIYRFRLIFTSAVGGALPLTFTGVKAYRHNTGVNIDWNTGTESNLNKFIVEKSVDGSNFKALTSIKANNLPENKYSCNDPFPATGSNYYRVASVDIGGGIKYSGITKINFESGFSVVKVFPNPVMNNRIDLQVINEPSGPYEVNLLSSFGQLILSKTFQHPGGSSTLSLMPQHLPHGIYQLEVLMPDHSKTNISVFY